MKRNIGHRHMPRECHMKTMTQREDSCGRMEAEMLFHCYKSRSTLGHQELEEAWKDPALDLSEREHSPANTLTLNL